MAQVSNYCKAYLAQELRKFPEWSEQFPPMVVRLKVAAPGEGETECFFVHDDYVVTAGVSREEKITFSHITPSWKAFCAEALGFKAPEAANKASE